MNETHDTDGQADVADGRRRTFVAARRHSGVVRALKVLIPAGAIVAVAAVAFVTLYNPFGRIPGLTLGPISFSGSKIAMESPKLTGYRKDNKPYEVTAVAAFQDIRKPNVIELKDMKARLAVDANGSMARLVSNAGVFDTGKEHLDLKDDIHVWTEKGEEIFLKSASVDFKTGSAVSKEAVRIKTPTLDLEAEGMEIADSGKTLVFTGRVRTRLTSAPAPAVASVKPTETGTVTRYTEAEARDRP